LPLQGGVGWIDWQPKIHTCTGDSPTHHENDDPLSHTQPERYFSAYAASADHGDQSSRAQSYGIQYQTSINRNRITALV
jgi:hypothetical protein